jgi:D-2-hydroxyglutarate dehydrogenase
MYAYDVSVPVRRMYGLVEDVRARLGERAVVTGFGHLGDGNLHIAVAAERFDVETEALLEPFIFEKTATERGSISAEHGIGFWKKNDIHYSQSPESVALMRKLKHMFDPAGILNPYKLVA